MQTSYSKTSAQTFSVGYLLNESVEVSLKCYLIRKREQSTLDLKKNYLNVRLGSDGVSLYTKNIEINGQVWPMLELCICIPCMYI